MVVTLDNVSKQFRHPNCQTLSTTLKSYFLYDMWHKKPPRRAPHVPPTWALRQINLQLTPGRTVGVIGRNGSGKSTLLKLISRILHPDEGSITIAGRVAALIELGAGFHPELTGRENVLINGVILGLTRREVRARMAQIIAFADIGAFIDCPVRTYSSGMYARLGFAVAIHVDPDVFLIDEILSVGDANFTYKCQATLRQLKQQGKAIMVVSHDLSAVRHFCDEVIWLDNGQIRCRGAAATVLRAYERAMQPPLIEHAT